MEPPFLIFAEGSAGIWASPSPTFADSLEASIDKLRTLGVVRLVSMVGMDEREELGLKTIQDTCADHGIDLTCFPIVDRTTPNSSANFSAFVAEQTDFFRNSHSICVHCKAGIGRTGMTIAGMLGCLGMGLEEAYDLISSKRGCLVPDTPGQFEWMQQHWLQITGRHE